MVKVSDSLPYVIPGTDVHNGDVITFVSGGTIRDKRETGFDRDTMEITVRLKNGKEKPLTLNRTTLKTLAVAYGDETDHWKGKKAQVELREQKVRGTDKTVLYLKPYTPLTEK